MIYQTIDFTTARAPNMFFGKLIKGVLNIGSRLPIVGGISRTILDVGRTTGIIRNGGGSRAMRAQIVGRVQQPPPGRITGRTTVTRQRGPGGIFGRSRTIQETFGARGQVRTGEFIEGEIETDAGRKRNGMDGDGGECPRCPKGTKLNKTTYHLSDGTRVAARSRCVAIRKRDALNGDAALRSTRRLVAYTKANNRIEKALRAAARGASSRR